MKDIILGQVRHILTAIGGACAARGVAASEDIEIIVGAVVALAGSIWSVIDKRASSKGKGAPAATALLAASIPLMVGCASIEPGNEAVVVNAERTIEMAVTAVDGFLAADHQNRELVRAKWPDVHAAAERLRQTFPTARLAAVNTLREYKRSRSGSDRDALESVVATLTTAMAEARQAMVKLGVDAK